MSRTAAREVAMMILYSGLVGGTDTPDAVCEKADGIRPLDETDTVYAKEIVAGVTEKAEEIDRVIGEHAVGWSLDRISRVDLSILRVAIYEMRWREDVPTGAAINEAVEMAKKYGGEKSFAFINGILGTVARQQETTDDQ